MVYSAECQLILSSRSCILKAITAKIATPVSTPHESCKISRTQTPAGAALDRSRPNHGNSNSNNSNNNSNNNNNNNSNNSNNNNSNNSSNNNNSNSSHLGSGASSLHR